MTSKIETVTIGVLSVFLIAISPLHAQEQEDSSLKLHINRDVGFGLAGLMQGTFSIQIDAPDEVVQVLFLLDGQEIGRDDQAPFGTRIITGEYDTGSHTFSAVGYATDGTEFESNKVTRQFVPANSTLLLAAVIVVLAVGVRFTAGFLARRKTGSEGQIAYGYKGGAICQNCGKPFAIHWWSPRLLGLRIDRCPHCSKWSTVRRVALEELREAEELKMQFKVDQSAEAAPESKEEEWQQKIEESRYDN